MSQLVDILYPLPDRRRTAWSALRWWESRRGFYNLVVGGAGLVTLGGVTTLAGWRLEPEILVMVFVYGWLANICYTFGWGIEMVARVIWGREAPDLGPLLFREGLIFSVGLTLLPLLVTYFVWLARLILWLAVG